MRKLSTGEPCAGEPLARFGGRGESGRALLYPYSAMDGELKYVHVSWIPAQIRLERIYINPKGSGQESPV